MRLTTAARAGALATAVTLLGLASTAAPAQATTTENPTPFASQIRRAGLTASQAAQLQHRVDRYLAQYGGKQVSANRILIPDGQITVAVPGETYARDLGATKKSAAKSAVRTPSGTVLPADASDCAYKNFCGWKGAHYTGDIWQKGKCNVYAEIPRGWNSGGSWWNNQTPGTVARMYGKTYNFVYQTPPASSYDPTGNWGPVWYVKPC